MGNLFGKLWAFLIHFYAIFAVIPILAFIIILYGYGVYSGDRKKALRLAMDITTVFLIGCVAALFNKLFGSQFGIYWIMLFMLLGGGLLGNAQFRKRGNVDAKRVFKAVWRLSFFTMSFFYVLFMIIAFGQILFTVA